MGNFGKIFGITSLLLLILVGIVGAAPFAYITHPYNNTIDVIDTTNNTVTATISVGNNPRYVAVNPDGTKVYVTNHEDNTTSVIDAATKKVIATVPVGYKPAGVVCSPDGSKVYVVNWGSNTVSVINTTTNSVISNVSVNKGPELVAVSPDGSKLYVTNYIDNTTSVIDSLTINVIATVPVGYKPAGVACSPDGSKVYVANSGDNTVSVIRTATNEVIATINVGKKPWEVAVTPDGKKAYVTNNENGCALTNEKKVILNGTTYTVSEIICGNTVSVIDTTNNTVTATISVGGYPNGVAVSPDGKEVYVVNADINGTVSVIDTATDKVKTTLSLGYCPYVLGKFIGGTVTINSNTPIDTYCPEIKDYVPEHTGGAIIHIVNAVGNDIIVSWAKENSQKAVFQVNIPAGQTRTVTTLGDSYDEYIRMKCSWYKVTPGPVVVKSGYEYSLKYYTVMENNTLIYDGTGFKPIPDSQAPKV